MELVTFEGTLVSLLSSASFIFIFVRYFDNRTFFLDSVSINKIPSRINIHKSPLSIFYLIHFLLLDAVSNSSVESRGESFCFISCMFHFYYLVLVRYFTRLSALVFNGS